MEGWGWRRGMWGIAVPIVLLVVAAVGARSADDPVVAVGFIATAPALAAVSAPVLWVAVVGIVSVVTAVATSAATLGQDFRSSLVVLIGVIAVAGISVMAAAVRPQPSGRAWERHERIGPAIGPSSAAARDEVDAITGLPGRAELLDSVGEGGAEDRWLALFDIDGLAAINDEHGREVGDTLLFAVAGRTRYALKELPDPDQQLVARWGDDEFLVVVSPADGGRLDALRAMVAKVNDHPIRSDAGLVPSTMTAGIVVWPAGTPLLDAVSRARRALHVAKLRGAAQCEVVPS